MSRPRAPFNVALFTRACSRLALFAIAAALASPLQAQVGKLTPEETARRGAGGPGGNNATTVQPSKDPRNFEGSYRSAQFGAPGGGGNAGMGAGAAGGQANAGRGAGGAPDGAPPGGGAPGGAPGGGAGGAGGPPAGFVPPTGPYTSANCVPSFSAFGGGPDGPTRVMQTPNQLTMVSEEMHQVRRIYINQEHPKDFKGSYSGDSVAHWEGDVLVVDTIGIKKVGAENAPASHTTERIRKLENGALEDAITTYNASGQANTRTSTLNFTGNQRVLEWICEDLGDVYFNEAIKL